jgi:ATP-dependent RNA/DNA helicase IGHMBP2
MGCQLLFQRSIFAAMEYFKELQRLLRMEQDEDRAAWKRMSSSVSLIDRRANGSSWFPIAIRDTEIGRGDYISIEVERTTHTDLMHQFRSGVSVALFSNHDAANDRVDGVVTRIKGNSMFISLRTDELPDWSRNGKLGVDLQFDEASYSEMERALKVAQELAEKKEEGRLTRVLAGLEEPTFNDNKLVNPIPQLNEKQNEAVAKILSANELAIVHGPPGTGKTTTLVQAIRLLVKNESGPVLVTAPSNAAVDLLSEKLAAAGLNVVRVGNPARVSEAQLTLTLDERMSSHPQFKEIRRLKRQASEFRDMAQKYKRSFGAAEREQRKLLFAEARNIAAEVERTEQYISADVLGKAQVITATLVGASHSSVRSINYRTVVIDEAGQGLEPACWIPILKGRKLVLAGDHCQLPPTIKSQQAAKEGLERTLLEKSVGRYPQSVVLLEEQYRMHEDIMGFSSREFYGGRLQAAASVATHTLPGEPPLRFIDTAGCGYEEKQEGTRISNPEEANFTLAQVTKLAAKLAEQADTVSRIGLIAPYRRQVELLKELAASHAILVSLGDRLTINTIDAFQGQERTAIFISLVRSNADNSIGFLSEVRRMNVAMTRAQKQLTVVGDSATLGQYGFYGDFIAYTQEREAYISAWELLY